MLAVVHINHNLERIGYQCVNIAKLFELTKATPIPANLIHDFTAMASRADEMLGLAMSSFANRDLEIASSLVTLDQSVNLAHHRFSDRLLDIDDDGESIREASLRAVLISRCLERIGDNCVDIGEQTGVSDHGPVRRVHGCVGDFATVIEIPRMLCANCGRGEMVGLDCPGVCLTHADDPTLINLPAVHDASPVAATGRPWAARLLFVAFPILRRRTASRRCSSRSSRISPRRCTGWPRWSCRIRPTWPRCTGPGSTRCTAARSRRPARSA